MSDVDAESDLIGEGEADVRALEGVGVVIVDTLSVGGELIGEGVVVEVPPGAERDALPLAVPKLPPSAERRSSGIAVLPARVQTWMTLVMASVP